MPRTTMQYEKTCIICQERFFTKRISTIYCRNKKCANKARSFPVAMLQQMIEKQALAMIIKEGPNKATVDYIREHNLLPAGPQNQNERLVPVVKPNPLIAHIIPLGQQQMLIDRMTREAVQRKIDAETIGKGNDAIEFTPVDPDKDLL